MSKVWIVNSSGHDFEEAKNFSEELIPLTYGIVNIFNVDRLSEEFKGKMSNYEEEDWLLLSGNAVLNVIASNIVMEKHGKVKLLIYDVIRKKYIPREFSQNK